MPPTPRPRARALIDAPLWLAVAWAAAAAFAAWLLGLLLSQSWPELRMAACFFLPFLLLLLIPHGLPPLLLALGAACFLVSAAGWALDWYTGHWWFDVALHFLNPLALVAGSMVMFWKADLLSARRPGRFVLASAALGLALGIAWELVELTYLVLTWPDTILDLVMDTAGAACGGWLAAWMVTARGEAPVGRRPAAPPMAVPIRVRR